MKMQKKFIIIGMGLSGLVFFCRLIEEFIKKRETGYRIFIVEKNHDYLATGAAYHINNPSIWTLNNTAASFKITPNGKNLAEWMKAYPKLWQPYFSGINEEYVPRALAGRYLQYYYQEYKQKAISHGIVIEEFFEEIIDVEYENNDHWKISTANNIIFNADFLSLCLGHASFNNYNNLKSNKNFIHNPADLLQLKNIPTNASIYILGGQSTFIDIALWLVCSHKVTAPIFSVTRNTNIITTKSHKEKIDGSVLTEFANTLKNNYGSNTMSITNGNLLFWEYYKKAVKNPITKQPTTKEALSSQLARYDLKFTDVQIGSVDELRSFVADFYFSPCYHLFWDRLCVDDKEKFHQHFYSLFIAYLTGTTPVNARLLLNLYNKNKIIELNGLIDIQYNERIKKFNLSFKDGTIHTAEYVINATGLSYDLNQDTSILIKNLIKKGYIVPKKWGGMMITDNYQAINNNQQIQKNLICIGPTALYAHKYPSPYASFLAMESATLALEGIKATIYGQRKYRLSKL